MSLEPLLNASPAIQLHVAAAVTAFVIGAIVLFRRKGDRPHKRLGRVWVGLMALVAVSSFFIWEIRMVGLFSPIHLVSLAVLFLLYQGVSYARRRNIKAHRRVMQLTYVLALVVTGLFTFMPGRIMNQVVFGPDGADVVGSTIFLSLAVLVLAAAIALVRRSSPRTRPARATV